MVAAEPYLKVFPASAPGASSGGWTAVDAFPNLNFEDPVSITPHKPSNRLYICSREGTVHAVTDDPAAKEKILVLDIRDVTQGYDDCGLLSLALHPEFGVAGSPNRGYFYVCYQYTPTPFSTPDRKRPPQWMPCYDRLSRFTIPDGWFEKSRDVAVVRASEQVLIHQFDENVYHAMNALMFADDGFLYVGIGDEGAGFDQLGNAQKIDNGLFCGVLRIDVNQDPAKSHPIRRQPKNGGDLPPGWPDSFSANYGIPNDNPWIDPSGGTLEEFWAIGLRNPYRLTYDPVDKRIWTGDIGQRTREEINIVRKGGNYGWSFREGTLAGPKPKPEPLIGVEVGPVYDYGRSEGDNAVIGGYVYRGKQFPELAGKYIFGDNTTNRIWALSYDGVNPPSVAFLTQLAWPPAYSGMCTFGLDTKDEIMMGRLGANSKVYRLARVGQPVADPPRLLSQTGVFADLKALTPARGIMPYEVNSPHFTDGAVKRHWLAVPDGGTVGFAPKGEWAFPNGTVFIQQLELAVDETNPATRKRLETRFLIRDSTGGAYGVTYRWRADGSEAELLTAAAAEEISIKTAAGTRKQTWGYPSRADCTTCHNGNAGYVLGVNTRQLNRGEQLGALNRAKLFRRALPETEAGHYDRLVALDDAKAPVEQRMRSYLDTNCAPCHRAGGVMAYFDARYDVPLARQGLVNGALANSLGMPNGKVIAPRDIAHSVMHLRLGSNESAKMPTIGRNTVDEQATAALREWISSLPADAGTRAADRIAVLTNHDVHFVARTKTTFNLMLSERVQPFMALERLSGDELAALKALLREPDAFVVAHVILSKVVDGVVYGGTTDLNGLSIDADFRSNVVIDPRQREKLVGYWEGRR